MGHPPEEGGEEEEEEEERPRDNNSTGAVPPTEPAQGQPHSGSSISIPVNYTQTWSGGPARPEGGRGGSGGASRSEFGEPLFDSDGRYQPRAEVPLRTQDDQRGLRAAEGGAGYGRSPETPTEPLFLLRPVSRAGW